MQVLNAAAEEFSGKEVKSPLPISSALKSTMLQDGEWKLTSRFKEAIQPKRVDTSLGCWGEQKGVGEGF